MQQICPVRVTVICRDAKEVRIQARRDTGTNPVGLSFTVVDNEAAPLLGGARAMSPPRAPIRYQNAYFSANCICRIATAVALIRPKLGLLRFEIGKPQTG